MEAPTPIEPDSRRMHEAPSYGDETDVLRTPVRLIRRKKPPGSEQVYVMQPRISGENSNKQRYVLSVSKRTSDSYEAIGDRLVQMINDGEITTIAQCKEKLKEFIDDGSTLDVN